MSTSTSAVMPETLTFQHDFEVKLWSRVYQASFEYLLKQGCSLEGAATNATEGADRAVRELRKRVFQEEQS